MNVERIRLIQADITTRDLDAIVNAANPQLANGGGVAGAIRVAAGRAFQEECDALVAADGPVAVGEAVITGGHALRARHVIHVVGPIYGQAGGHEAELLGRAHRSAITVAASHGCRSLAFPAISTGIFGYPVEEAAPIALEAVAGALDETQGVDLVEFCLFSERDLREFTRAHEAIARQRSG
jgi:O-acetyl-ADP-ribose deacetylase (regulator of RNase III)